MEDIESKLGQILSDPQMMGKIMSLAQSFGAQEDAPPVQEQHQQIPSMPEIDIGTIQKISSIMSQTGIDRHQQALLQALAPYLSHQRVNKLEKAMRAAKLAGMASSFLGSRQIFSGR